MSRVLGWISGESLTRLRMGGNGARGTVPIHHAQSHVARTPVYLDAPESVGALAEAVSLLMRVSEDGDAFLMPEIEAFVEKHDAGERTCP